MSKKSMRSTTPNTRAIRAAATSHQACLRAVVVASEVDIEDWDDPHGHPEGLTGNRTVPQIVLGDRILGGYDTSLKLTRSGEIDEVLEEVTGA